MSRADRHSQTDLDGLAFVSIAAVAAALRLHDLSALPLSPAEAGDAWQAWRAAVGAGTLPASGNLAPPSSALLYGLQSVLFWILPAGDFLARSVPAVCGTLLVLLPYFVRDLLGRVPALALAAVLAVDPWQVAIGRTVDGAALSVLLGAAVLVGVARCVGARGATAVGATSLAFGMLLSTGSQAFGIVGVIALAILLYRRELTHLARREGDSPWRWVGLAAVGTTAASTVFLLHPRGASLVSASFSTWIGQWGDGATAGLAVMDAVRSHPLPFALGVAGLFLLWIEARLGDLRPIFILTAWILWATLLGLAHDVLSLVWLDLALWLAAVTSLARLFYARDVIVSGRRLAWGVAAFIVVLGAFVRLGGHAFENALAVLAFLLACTAWMAARHATWRTVRGIGLILGFVALGLTFRAAWQEPALPNGTRPWVSWPGSEARKLASDVQALRTRAASTAPQWIHVDVAPDPILGWYLRDVPGLRWDARATASTVDGEPLLRITAMPADGSVPDSYCVGSRYRLRPNEDGEPQVSTEWRPHPSSVVLWAKRDAR